MNSPKDSLNSYSTRTGEEAEDEEHEEEEEEDEDEEITPAELIEKLQQVEYHLL